MSADPSDGEFGCEKCGNQSASTDEISTTGSGLSKMFDIQTKKFTVVSCDNCGYSELYRDVGNRGSDVVDVFFG